MQSSYWFILVYFLLLLSNTSFSQTTYLKTQFEIDNFDPTITTIDGDLLLRGENSVITNIAGLKNIEEISGQLRIEYCRQLTNLNGFRNLISVGKGIRLLEADSLTDLDGFQALMDLTKDGDVNSRISITGNDNLENIEGLRKLQKVDGNISIINNPKLKNLAGLENIEYVNYGLTISNNEILESIDEFASLLNIGSSINYTGSYIDISNNPSLAACCSIKAALENIKAPLSSITIEDNLDACNSVTTIIEDPSCTNVNENETVAFNVSLLSQDEVDDFDSRVTRVIGFLIIGDDTTDIVNLENLSSIQTVEGYVSISNNIDLKNLGGLQITSIQEYLSIGGNSELQNLDGLQITSIKGSLSIEGNSELQNLDGLSSLISLGGNLSIRNNERLTNMEGLKNTFFQLPSCIITDNPLLLSLSGLDNLRYANSITLQNNESLLDIAALSKLELTTRNFEISNNPSISTIPRFEKLKSLGGLVLRSNPLLEDIEGFSSLTALTSGSLSITNNESLASLDGLKKLEEVHNQVSISNNPELTTLDGLEKLDEIGGSLSIHSNAKLENLEGLVTLDIVEGDLYLSNLPLITTLRPLREISGTIADLTIISCNNLVDLTGLETITNVRESLNIKNNALLEDISALKGTRFGSIQISNNENLISLNGLEGARNVSPVLISNNPLLTNLDALSNLKSCRGSLIIRDNDNLVNIDSLVNLSAIGTLEIVRNASLERLMNFSHLDKINEIEIIDNPSLVEINSFISIVYLGDVLISGLLEISGNERLTTIDGFNNLIRLTRGDEQFNYDPGPASIEISDNPVLTDIRGLANITSIEGNLQISNNKILSDCCSISDLLEDGSKYQYANIKDNPSLCSTVNEIITKCNYPDEVIFRLTNSLIGNFFLGTNGQCDSLALEFDNPVKWDIEYDTSFFSIYSPTQDGTTNLPLPDGQVKISPCLNFDLFTIDPISLSLTLGTQDTVYQDFCVSPSDSLVTDAAISIVPLSIPRPGFEVDYKVIIKNKGNLPLTGTADFLYSEDHMDFVSSDRPIVIEDGKVSMSFLDLLPLGQEEFLLTLLLNTPTDSISLLGGENLNFKAVVVTSGDDINYNNAAALTEIVVNSYDPNDKQCLEGEFLMDSLLGNYLTYKIRFENTGTAAASMVRIDDMIDTTVYEIHTIEIIDASHDMKTIIQGDRVQFYFSEINLPFDGDNNDGYVVFRIKTKDSLKIDENIENAASIYFDFNPAVNTNRYSTTVVTDMDGDGFHGGYDCDDLDPQVNSAAEEIPNNDIDENCDGEYGTSNTIENDFVFNVFPNPTYDILYITNNRIENYLIKLYSTDGTLVLQKNNATQLQLNVLPKGLYIIQFFNSRGDFYTDKIVVR